MRKILIFLSVLDKNNRQIKKSSIGEIKNADIDRTGYYVFLTGLENKDMYVSQMIEKIKENAKKKVHKFKSIYNNAILCEIKIMDVEPE